MNGKMIVSKPLYVALAQRKEERRARLQVYFRIFNLPKDIVYAKVSNTENLGEGPKCACFCFMLSICSLQMKVLPMHV